MRLKSKKPKPMVVSRFHTIASSYCDLTLGSAELEEVKSLRSLGVTLGSKLTFENHLRKLVSKSARRLGVMRRAGSLFYCPRVTKSCFNAYFLSSLEYCAPVRTSSVESQLGSLDSIVPRAERLCESEICCSGPRRKVLCLLYKNYHRVDYPINKYLNHFDSTRNTKVSGAVYEFALVIS